MNRDTKTLAFLLTTIFCITAFFFAQTADFIYPNLTFFSWRLLTCEIVAIFVSYWITVAKSQIKLSYWDAAKEIAIQLGVVSFSAFMLASMNTGNADHEALRRLVCSFQGNNCPFSAKYQPTFFYTYTDRCLGNSRRCPIHI